MKGVVRQSRGSLIEFSSQTEQWLMSTALISLLASLGYESNTCPLFNLR